MAFQSGQEIERTWIVKEMPPRNELNIEPGRLHSVVQDYILLDGSGELRTRKVLYIERNKVEYDMAIKIGNGMVRTEVLKQLTKEEWKSLHKVAKASLQQTLVPCFTFVIHVYKGKLKGLALVEVEFPNISESKRFIPPYWFGKEVTTDIRFRGKSLAFSDSIPQ